MEHCDECGFDYYLRLAPGAGTAIVAGVAELAGLVTDGRRAGRPVAALARDVVAPRVRQLAG